MEDYEQEHRLVKLGHDQRFGDKVDLGLVFKHHEYVRLVMNLVRMGLAVGTQVVVAAHSTTRRKLRVKVLFTFTGLTLH